MDKLYNRIIWQNNTTPALNQTNLNAMSKGLDDLDDRVIALASTILETVPEIEEELSDADALVERLQALTENPPYIGANGNWYVWDTNTGAYVDSNVDASITVAIADITMLAPDATPYVTNTGTDTDPIFHLFIPRGKGISSVTKTSTSGLVDTYTITYSDGYTSTFTVTNGKGISSISKTGASGLVDTYTITYNDGSSTTFTVTNGKTAYQSAVEGGYTGTEAQFEAALGNFQTYASNAEQGASDAEAYAKGTRGGSDVSSSDAAYHNNAKYYSEQSASSAQASAGSATSSAGSASDAEAYGAGTRNGVDVGSSDPAYHNNAKYYSQQAAGQSLGGLDDVDIDTNTLQDGDSLIYDGTARKWTNGAGSAPTIIQNVPSQSGSLTYDGTSQSPTWSNYDSNMMTIGGTTSATSAGTYTATFTPKRGYCWSDSSRTPISVSWTIGQATGSVTLSKNSVTLDTSTSSDTVTASNATGTLSVSSSDSTVATASVSGNIITISSVNNTTGTATITVSVAASADGNYTAATASISVAAQFAPPLVSWSTGSDQEIADMINAYYEGSLSLQDIKSVWTIGDERTVAFGAMAATGVGESHDAGNLTFVIMNWGGKTLKTSINGHSECLMIVGIKENFRPAGHMNSTNTNAGGWRDCARRTWCNGVFRDAITSSIFKNLFKQHYNLSGQGSGTSSGTYQTEDYFALPAEIEVFGSTTYSVSGEGSQFKYYETAANRIKYRTDNGSASGWWERSPISGYSNGFCLVSSGGSAGNYSASHTDGLAPFGCV